MQYPKFGFIRQKFPKVDNPDPRRAVVAELERTGILGPVRKGDRVLITGGSRGIEAMNEVLGTCIAAATERAETLWSTPRWEAMAAGPRTARSTFYATWG